MKLFKLGDMFNGWFIGDFIPTVYPSKNFEVALKKYTAGQVEERHTHKIAKEITLVVGGKVLMNGMEYSEGDIIFINPGESTDFKSITNSSTVVVKIPSIKGDKYKE